MWVESVELEQFRNYEGFACRFEPGINIIAGRNAQGKTNLLEALYLLATTRSFRTRHDAELIRFGALGARLRGQFLGEGNPLAIEIRLTRGQRRQLLANGLRKSAAELSGRRSAILFSPEDLDLVRGGAAGRRRMADLAICQLRPRYTEALGEYGRLYRHKTRILKDGREKPALLQMLDDFSLRMARAGAELIYYRAAWCAKLAKTAPAAHAAISGGETLTLRYSAAAGLGEAQGLSRQEIFTALVQHYQAHRAAELASGQCLSGPHKDEIELSIGGAPAREFASQGQARTAALALRLGERDIAREDTGVPPLLLLDDVLSELDARRQDFVLNRIGGGQVFITCCEDGGIQRKTGARVLRIEGGALLAPGEG